MDLSDSKCLSYHYMKTQEFVIHPYHFSPPRILLFYTLQKSFNYANSSIISNYV